MKGGSPVTEDGGSDARTLTGAVIESLERAPQGVVLALTAPDGRRLRLHLVGPFHLEKRRRPLLAPGTPGAHEAVFDSRAHALSALLAIVRPAVGEGTATGGGLLLRWGDSFRLEVPGPAAGSGPTWHLSELPAPVGPPGPAGPPPASLTGTGPPSHG